MELLIYRVIKTQAELLRHSLELLRYTGSYRVSLAHIRKCKKMMMFNPSLCTLVRINWVPIPTRKCKKMMMFNPSLCTLVRINYND